MKRMNIGIIGYGFVGKATELIFSQCADVRVYDTAPEKVPAWFTLADVASKSSIVFVCVPTPMRPDGSCDTSIVESVLSELADFDDCIVAIRSTVPPGFCDSMALKYALPIVFVPEFLTEKNWDRDAKFPHRVVIGGDDHSAKVVAAVFYQAYRAVRAEGDPYSPYLPLILSTSAKEAELGKLMANGLMATKVAFCNEVYRLANTIGADYARVRDVVVTDRRIGGDHTQVPGPDGKLGFGGTCFTKDMNNLMSAFDVWGVDEEIITAVIVSNEKIRPNSELEVGRAISKPDVLKRE